MRRRRKNANISVHAIAGTHVVLLGLDATAKAAKGLLGFTIYKRKGKGKEQALGGGKIFAGVHPPSKAERLRSDKAPIQGFMWSDYVVEPATSYSYRVVPVYGTPGALKPKAGVTVTLQTEALVDGTHGVHFNRGAAGSQAYARMTEDIRRWVKVTYQVTNRTTKEKENRYKWTPFQKPSDVKDGSAYKWLSRGLEEAMIGFIGEAEDDTYSLRASVYEFTHRPAIEAFVTALEAGADVKIVHHAKTVISRKTKTARRKIPGVKKGEKPQTEATANITVDYPTSDRKSVVFKKMDMVEGRVPDPVAKAANDAVAAAGISKNSKEVREAFDTMMLPRTHPSISHNKFIVLLKDDEPIAVWTGSTNFTPGGIYGQSNVGHIVRDSAVAKKYLEYWEALSTNPPNGSGKETDPPEKGMRNWNFSKRPEFKKEPPPPNSITPVFSPRPKQTMLKWIASRMSAAESSVHLTLAFTVAADMLTVLKKKSGRDNPFARYLLLDGKGGLMAKPLPEMKKISQNHIVWGETMKPRESDEEGEYQKHIEALTGLNDNVNYLHTKYLLIDALTDDPVVVTGSANFSDPSITNNDENLLIIRGDTRVADIYLGEFMRIFTHFQARNETNQMSHEEAREAAVLRPDDGWTKNYYKKGDPAEQERLLYR